MLLALFTPTLSWSQIITESVNYINYSIKDGLPSSETYDVFQDSKGFIWVGTDNGAVRYNGANFEVFTTLDGLTDNTIFRIQEDNLGRVWFMTYNRKLCYYENGVFHPYQFNDVLAKETENYYSGNTITDIQFDANGDLEFLFVNFAVVKISSKGEILTSFFSNLGDIPIIHKSSTYYETTKNSLLKFKEHTLHHKFIIESAKFGKVHFLVRDSIVAIGTNSGLITYSYPGLANKKSILNGYSITGYTIDFEGSLWCSSLFNGVFYIPNPKLSVFKISSAKRGQIHAILPLNNQVQFYYNLGEDYYQTTPDYNHLENSNAFTDLRKIRKKDLKEGIKFESPIFFHGVFNSATSMVEISPDKTLFACDRKGLVVVEGEIDSMPNFNEAVVKTKHNPNFESKWLRTPDQLNMVMITDTLIYSTTISQFKFKVLKILKDSKENYWLGTLYGLYQFNLPNQTLNKVSIYPQFQDLRIQDIIESKDGTMFFATKANGIFYVKNNSVNQLDSKNNLLSNNINQIIYEPEENQVWVASTKGISVLKQKNSNIWSPEPIITKHDGIELPDIRQITFFKNYLFFAGNVGVGKINKSDLQRKNSTPIFYVKSILVNEHKQLENNNLTLPYDSNNIVVNYQGISYKSLNKFNYKYRLLPNQSWQTTSNSNVNFNSLAPGNYTLEIKAQNPFGIESPTTSIIITIEPAFWMTMWFRILVVIIAIFIGYQGFVRTIRTYKSQVKFQRIINEMQVISLQAKMNPHFIFNSLNSIQNYILRNEPEQANNYLIDFSNLIRIILQNSDSTTVILRKEMEILKMYVDLEQKRLRTTFSYSVEINSNINYDYCELPTLLIQPYVENAIWHGKVYSNPDGEIKISINRIKDKLFFEIKDNGIGVKSAQSSKLKSGTTDHKSIGSAVTKKRIELLSELNNQMSNVEIFEANELSPKFVGTIVRFNIPYVIKNKTK